MKLFYTFLFSLMALQLCGQVNINVDLSKESHVVSPFLYGRNNSLSASPEWTKLKDAKVRFFREGGGNNSTKYNWRRRLSSHPDWYNNVYTNDWDFAVQALQNNIPSAQGMWSFQLIGKAAKTTSANFNDWNYNGSQWWSGVAQNLAGGGVVNPAGGADALTEGDPELYLENWTADSTVGILSHWFDELSVNKNQLVYWSMDNEPEIWNGTHDDVMPTQLSAEDFMQRYFAVAKKARALFPEIKLVGPVPANEWQWYNWPNTISSGGRNYSWLEFFIKRVGEEEQASGMKLLDVLDIHFYPGSKNTSEVVQYHRVYFDKNYVFPEANGVKNVTGSWDNSQNKEYIFERCQAWLKQYMGDDHGVTFSVSETGIEWINATTSAIWYASTLGEFMKHPEMEFFTPWTWQVGMWETLHLFSAYNKESFVPVTSGEEEFVSAYPTINEAKDSITLILVNRSTNQAKSTKVNFNGFVLAGESFQVLRLSNLAAAETFVSHTNNALQKTTIDRSGNSLNVSLPPMSITSILLKGSEGEVTGIEDASGEAMINVYPNPVPTARELTVKIHASGKATLRLLDIHGKQVISVLDQTIIREGHQDTINTQQLRKGMYILQLSLDERIVHRKVVVE